MPQPPAPIAGPPSFRPPVREAPIEAEVVGPRATATVNAEIVGPPPEKSSPAESLSDYARAPSNRMLPERLWLGAFWAWECFFGAITLMVVLAVLATVPVLNLLSLGYLLEASGRVARTGKLREGFVGLRKAYRVGSLVAGTYLMLLPLWLLSDVWYQSSLIDPTSGMTIGLRIALIICTTLMLGHILLAWYAGGKFRHFFWPILFPFELAYGTLVWLHHKKAMHNEWPPPILLIQGLARGNFYSEARDAVWDFVMGLRLPYFFWLGLRGFVGAILWLALPVGVLLLAANSEEGVGVLLGFIGSVLMSVVVLYLPFMQAHFAAENRFRAMFEWWTVRMHFRRAPLAFWSALFITLLFAIPLYLLKIEATPREVTWLPALVFVAFMFPARLLTGWAMGRARRREKPRFILLRWLARLGAVPVVFVYVFFLYFSQYLSWDGTWSLLEQHAFLVPVPFFGV